MPNGGIEDLWRELIEIKAHGCARREDDMAIVNDVKRDVEGLKKVLNSARNYLIVNLAGLVIVLVKLFFVTK